MQEILAEASKTFCHMVAFNRLVVGSVLLAAYWMVVASVTLYSFQILISISLATMYCIVARYTDLGGCYIAWNMK